MTNLAGEQEILRGIVEIALDQQELERHQRSMQASAGSIQDSMAYAYNSIMSLLEPFLRGCDSFGFGPDSTPSERKP